MARGKPHSEETRAQVMAALMAGQPVTEIAVNLNIPARVIWRWKKEQLAEVVSAKQERTLLLVYEYLHANLEAIKAQCKIAGDEKFLRKQPASQVAELHGAMADRAFRILDAIQRTDESEEDAP